MKEKNIYINGKKGEKLYVFWWFLAATLVFVVIALTTVNFFAKPIDTRETQAKIVFLNIYDCLAKNGMLKEEVLQTSFNLGDNCFYSDNIMKSNKEYLNVTVTNSSGKILFNQSLGDSSIEGDCNVKTSDSEYFPYCYEFKLPVYYFDKNEKKTAVIRILSASNNLGERISFLPDLGGQNA